MRIPKTYFAVHSNQFGHLWLDMKIMLGCFMKEEPIESGKTELNKWAALHHAYKAAAVHCNHRFECIVIPAAI